LSYCVDVKGNNHFLAHQFVHFPHCENKKEMQSEGEKDEMKREEKRKREEKEKGKEER
jgi:hypothetical protein